jgi:hypothetical protein
MAQGVSDIMNSGQVAAIMMMALLIILIGACVSELMFLSNLYAKADKVQCDFFGCTFTTQIKNTTVSKQCFENGQQINCSSLSDDAEWKVMEI